MVFFPPFFSSALGQERTVRKGPRRAKRQRETGREAERGMHKEREGGREMTSKGKKERGKMRHGVLGEEGGRDEVHQ